VFKRGRGKEGIELAEVQRRRGEMLGRGRVREVDNRRKGTLGTKSGGKEEVLGGGDSRWACRRGGRGVDNLGQVLSRVIG